MSHNHAGHVPYITDHTTALSTAGAGQTLAITGFGLSLATTVTIPAVLGVETSRSYTKASATSGTLTITMTVAAIPSTPVSRSIAISQGGVPCQGSDVTNGAVSVLHGFTPESLVKNAFDGWFNPTGMKTGAGATPSDGDTVAEWRVNGTTSGFSKLYKSTDADRPTYVAAHTGYDSSDNHPGLTESLDGTSGNLVSDADGTWARANADNYTFAMVMSPTAGSSWGRVFMRWVPIVGSNSESYEDYIHHTGSTYNRGPHQNKIVSRVRETSSVYDQAYEPTDGAGTRRIVLRRDGANVSVFYNSGAAVQTYTTGNSETAAATQAQVYADEGVVSEVLFLKYAATDEEVGNLMSYWNDKYGS